MKNKKIIFIITIIFIIIGITIYFFSKNNYKTTEFGNTTIKSAEDIKEYILNLESYEAQISVEVSGNKNKNQYKMKQVYKAPNLGRLEILEPQSVKGVVTTYDGNNLKIENTKLNLSKIYENYPYVAENALWLSDFINQYKNNPNATFKEEENQIIMQIEIKDKSIIQNLYIDTKTKKPTKLTLEDMNKKMLVYILYNEIKINSSR
jgi:outer membrane lipoprotein-sorting protein